MRILALGLALAAVSGCTVSIPEGRLRCTTSADCPSRYACIEGTCWSPSVDGGVDVGVDAGLDAGRDAPLPDVGRDAPPGVDAPDAPPPVVVDIDCGDGHSCAVLDDGRVYCWGTNELGEIGDGSASTTDVTTAREVVALAGLGVTDVSLGAHHSCAIAPGDRMWCWGSNQQGQLGDTDVSMFADSPNEVVLPAPPIAMDAGGRFTCALLDDGRVFCWGEDNNGEMGDGMASFFDVRTPQLVTMPTARSARAISAGTDHACAVLDDDTVACWGWNGTGQIGNGSTNGEVPTPTVVAGLTGTRVYALGYHTCAIDTGGVLECWGRNNTWQLGQDEIGPVNEGAPLPVDLGDPPRWVAGGDDFFGGGHTCAAGDLLGLHCWGWNNRGQLGLGTALDGHAPAPVATLARVEALAAGAGHTCAVSAGEAYCWGRNDDGQLGIASMMESRVPMAVMGLP